MRWPRIPDFRKLLPGDLTAAGVPANAACGVADFHRIGVSTVRDLRRRLAVDGWKLDKLLADMNAKRPAGQAPLDRLDVMEVITSVAEKRAAWLGQPWWRGLPRVLGAVLVALAFLIAWKLVNPPVAKRQQLIVARSAGIPAYHLILPTDVRLEERVLDPQGMQLGEELVGRYAARALKPGELVRAGDLRDGTQLKDLNDRVIVTIPVTHADGALAASLPAVVMLLLNDPAGGRTRREEGVYLLGLTREPPAGSPPTPGLSMATVALPGATLEALQPLLGASSAMVAWPPPR